MFIVVVLEEYSNFDLTNIIPPVNVNVLKSLLKEAKYHEAETRFLVNGFIFGFDLGYTTRQAADFSEFALSGVDHQKFYGLN